MECLSENTIQELVAGVMSSEARAHAHRHIDACAACWTLVIELARDGDLVAPIAASPRTGVLDPRVLAGRFELVRPLGRGGMGTVYEAVDRERGIQVALKILQHVSADSLLRFKQEFRAVQDVHHPNLVTLNDLIEERGEWWLTMELVDGVSFVRHVRPAGQLDERRLRAALPQLAAGLSALHAHGLVHRDVKPHNVLVTGAGRVVLLDFGLVADTTQSESNVVGTPAYMAPEQGRLTEIGPAADWYGVGALLYEVLTGVLPFTGTPLQVMVAKQHELPRRPRELAGVPDDLDTLCMQLLAIDPPARLDAAATLATAAAAAPPSLHSPRSPGPKFVGRERELQNLADAFAATRGGAEAIVLIEGESGIGKSALVHRFLEDLQRQQPDVRILAGRCYERETVPYKGVDGVIDALARCLRKLPGTEAAAVLPRRAGLLRHAFPVLAKVPALSTLANDDVADRVELRYRVFTALRDLLGRLAERSPLVVWIDDLQWADSDSLELLTWVMARPEAPPLLLLLTSRPSRSTGDSSTDATAARVRALSGLRVLELMPLAREEAVALAECLLAENPLSCAVNAALLADEAAGHPLFIETLVRHTVVGTPSSCHFRLSDALWTRINEVDAPARELLALIAVAGSPVSPEILRAAANLPAGDVDPALARLRGAYLTRSVDHTDKSVEPYHDRVREAVLEHLAPERRKTCHRSLAHALMRTIAAMDAPVDARASSADAQRTSSSGTAWGPEAVAVHLHAADDVEQAARYLLRAADQAVTALAFDRAARLYREALAIHDQTGALAGDAHDARTRLAHALVSASRASEAAEVYFELARNAAGRGEEDLSLRLRGVEQLLRSGQREAGRHELANVLEDLELSPAASRAGALWRLVYRRASLRLRGLRAFLPGSSIAVREMPARERLRLEACWAAAALSTDLAPEYLTRYQVLARKAADLRSCCMALVVEANITVMSRARRHAEVMDALAAAVAQSDDPYVRGLEQTARAVTAMAGGQWSRGREHAARAMQLFRDSCVGAALERTRAAVNYFQCLQYLGEYRVLMREIRPLLREAEERDDHFTVAHLHIGALRPMWLDDHPEAARQQLERAMARWTGGEHDFPQLMAQFSHAAIELYEGDGAAAYRRLVSIQRRWLHTPAARMAFARRPAGVLLAQQGHWLRSRAFSLRGLAALAVCRSDRPDHRLIRSVMRDARALRAMRLSWTCGLARILAAGVAVVNGARDRAREQLELANADFLASNMPLYAAVARRRLGELQGGGDGARLVAEADALLAAQDIRVPEHFARLLAPEVAVGPATRPRSRAQV